MEPKRGMNLKEIARVGVDSLKTVVEDTQFPFKTIERVPGLTGIVGQERGRNAMPFGLQVNKPGYNIYFSGLSGTGKTSCTNVIVLEFAKKRLSIMIGAMCIILKTS
jgi:predicted AAA+ superfamily ATPase